VMEDGTEDGSNRVKRAHRAINPGSEKMTTKTAKSVLVVYLRTLRYLPTGTYLPTAPVPSTYLKPTCATC
jgi:hypothetical protein